VWGAAMAIDNVKIEKIRRLDFFEESHFIFCGFEIFWVIELFEVDFEILGICCESLDLSFDGDLLV